MPKKKTIKKTTEVAGVDTAKKPVELAVKENECQPCKVSELAESYSVFNKMNQFVRRYTPELHGDKRKELAEEFSKKIGGTIKEI